MSKSKHEHAVTSTNTRNPQEPSPSSNSQDGSRGWQSLGDVAGVRADDGELLIECGRALLKITPEREEIVRVRLAQDGRFARDHSWAVIDEPGPRQELRAEENNAWVTLIADALRVRIQRRPCRVAFLSADGDPICTDDPRKGMCWDGDEIACHKVLHDDDHFFGLGEKGCPLDKRGTVLVNWNTDDPYHQPWSDPLYQTHPFLLVFNRGRAYGIFFDDIRRSWFDLGKTSTAAYAFGAEGGEMNYYFIPGPTPAEVLRRYARLIGMTPLPPRWALGFHQCRWGYKTAARIRKLARDFRTRKIPCDAIWFDIDYLDGFRCFTWHPKNFARPERLLKDLDRQGFKAVVIIDPGLKREPGYAAYDSGIAGGHFCRGPDGRVYVGKAWPGECVFPDFTRPATGAWWGELNRGLLDAGVAGIWNDMNEPVDFTQPTHLVPWDVRMDNDGEPSDHRAMHNVYGLQMARATFEGCRRLRPDRRPFVLTRAGYAGVQRYAAVWTGDNLSNREHLRMSIPMLLNMGLSNIPFCGADIGGFREHPSAELFTRWLQLGIFYPFCRVHTAGRPEQDPFSFGAKFERVNRRAIELRYRLLPYLYTEFQHACATGLPLMRPLLLDFPLHPDVQHCEHEFMFGRQLLVAPVVEEGATIRKLRLPAGHWYSFADGTPFGTTSPTAARASAGTRVAGQSEEDILAASDEEASSVSAVEPSDVEVPVTLESIPVFARTGAIIPLREVVQHVDEKQLSELTLRIFPGSGAGWFYNDDGSSPAYIAGEYTLEGYRQEHRATGTIFRLADREGMERFAPESYLLEFVAIRRRPPRILRDGKPVPPCKSEKSLQRVAAGWHFDRRAAILRIRLGRLNPGQTVELLR